MREVELWRLWQKWEEKVKPCLFLVISCVFGDWNKVFRIWDGVLGSWDGIFCIWDSKFGTWNWVIYIWCETFYTSLRNFTPPPDVAILTALADDQKCWQLWTMGGCNCHVLQFSWECKEKDWHVDESAWCCSNQKGRNKECTEILAMDDIDHLKVTIR